ncbi:MAG: plasmid recombination protein [Deltaproteobacteria bacterium]|jgi:hypothetical protein|nr:plasmid recombination protein [Deltaproteobacteria bacterium]
MGYNFTIKISKLKTWSLVSSYYAHNTRTEVVVNADANRTPLNRLLIGEPDIDPKAWCLARLNGQRVSPRQVLVVSMILEATPDYFRPGRAGRPGEYAPERLEPWVKASQEWLEETVGSQIILNAALHLDEVTPHIHVLILPLTASNKLNCYQFLCDNMLTSYYSKSYFYKLKDLGFIWIKHHNIKRSIPKLFSYYSYVQVSHNPTPDLSPLDLIRPKNPGPISLLWPGANQKHAQKAALAALEQGIKARKEIFQDCKRRIVSLNKDFELMKNNTKDCYRRIVLSLDNFQLMNDQHTEKWLSKCLGLKPKELPGGASQGQRSQPTPGLTPTSLGELNDSQPRKNKIRRLIFPEMKADFDLDEERTIRIGQGYWRDGLSRIQGQGSMAFLTYIYSYGQAKRAQVAKIIASDQRMFQCLTQQKNSVNNAAKSLARYNLGFLDSRMAMALEKWRRTPQSDWPAVFIDPEKIQRIKNAGVAERAPFYLTSSDRELTQAKELVKENKEVKETIKALAPRPRLSNDQNPKIEPKMEPEKDPAIESRYPLQPKL